MPTTDRLQTIIEVGQTVFIPCKVLAVTQTPTPTVQLQTVYPGFDGNVDTITNTLDAIQVIVQT